MNMQTIIEGAERNIRQALQDYAAHTDQTNVLDDVSDVFIERLAKDSSYAKKGLRELFSKSPVWRPELDALVINGTRTHDPDYQRVSDRAHEILREPFAKARNEENYVRLELLRDAIGFFARPDVESAQIKGIAALNALAPKAYQPGKKLSRVFKALCVALGVADETAGSKFQRLYAQFADELSSRKIAFKLFVSINPAHFLTMSNPKFDQRGPCLTSCHSLNSTEYPYNCGCVGYARDEVSFIVFTVVDPDDDETLNNRKTTRQIFAYEPGNGVLLQSRMYNTSGGVFGQAEDSKLYRDLIQREISELEDQPNLWKVYDSTDATFGAELIHTGEGFGGYADWTYRDFDGKVCVRFDHWEHGELVNCEPLEVGTWGLCVCCGEKIYEGMYCDNCRIASRCDDCGRGVREDDLYEVYDCDGHTRYVCEDCRSEYYIRCDHCDEYWAEDATVCVNGRNVCPNCLEEYYERCSDCGDYYLRDNMSCATGQYGDEAAICPNCRDEYYEVCDHCGELFHEDFLYNVCDSSGDVIRVCEDCLNEYYAECEKCGEFYEARALEDGLCPDCRKLEREDDGDMKEVM